jgi:hypothetical protein
VGWFEVARSKKRYIVALFKNREHKIMIIIRLQSGHVNSILLIRVLRRCMNPPDYDHYHGCPLAPIELIQYGDFQCE